MSSAEEGLSRPLPEPVRAHVVDLAAQVLGTLPPSAVPPPLRTIARFDPRKRAKLGGAPIATQLETDKTFRETVAEALTEAWPELVRSLAEGTVPAAADPVIVAAAAYLTRPPGWPDLVETARAELERCAAVAEETAHFRPHVVYEKFRTTYELGEAEVVLDEMPFGPFVEVEGPADAIGRALDRLGLADAPRILVSYLALFERVKAALKLDAHDLTFDNFAGVIVPPEVFVGHH